MGRGNMDGQKSETRNKKSRQKKVTKTFLANREEILAYYGAYLFQEDTIAERRVKMKVITNAYDMDAAENMWVKNMETHIKGAWEGK